jgi:hypothetical protein
VTPAQAKRQRKELMRQIARDHAPAARAKIAELRRQIAEARSAKRTAFVDARARCKSERTAARVRVRELRARLLAEIRAAVSRERALARDQCTADLAAAKEIAHRGQRARAELKAERDYRRELKRIERGNKRARLEHKRATARERRGESDDEVRANLSPEYLGLFERVKSKIRGEDRMTRTEAFLHYAEEHPAELLEGIEERTDAMIRELEQKEKETRRELRRGPKLPKVGALVYSDVVPF